LNCFPRPSKRTDKKKAYVPLAAGTSLAISKQQEDPTKTKKKEEKK